MIRHITAHKAPTLIALIVIVLAASMLWMRVVANPAPSAYYIGGYNVPEAPGERAKQAFSVALVTVATIGPARWDTRDGEAPGTLSLDTSENVPVIYQPVTLKVEKYLKHSLNLDELMIRKVGGTVGKTTMPSLEGLELSQGQQAVVFFTRELPIGTWKYSSIYTIEGATATSVWDKNQMKVNDLLAAVALNSR